MFEHFTERARSAVVLAQHEAHELRHNYIGTEHLLLGLLREGTGVGGQALDRLGVRLEDVRSDIIGTVGEGSPVDLLERDAEALRAIGIDLDEVRRRIEESFGAGALDQPVRRSRRGGRAKRCASPRGAIPFTPRAKKSLELALREAKRLRHAYIGTHTSAPSTSCSA